SRSRYPTNFLSRGPAVPAVRSQYSYSLPPASNDCSGLRRVARRVERYATPVCVVTIIGRLGPAGSHLKSRRLMAESKLPAHRGYIGPAVRSGGDALVLSLVGPTPDPDHRPPGTGLCKVHHTPD